MNLFFIWKSYVNVNNNTQRFLKVVLIVESVENFQMIICSFKGCQCRFKKYFV